MAWFKRKTKGIQTSTKEKKDTPEGLWHKTPTGKIIDTEELEKNFYVSPEDGFHLRIGSEEYFKILFDNDFKEIDKNIKSKDPLKFSDNKSYKQRSKDARKKSGLKDAIRVAFGKSHGENVVIACMDFKYIGGSMGSVVGEKISRAIDLAIKKKTPLIIISKVRWR
jgi:acetyl-CoA carboxylase carboxyl transferase subunit beta